MDTKEEKREKYNKAAQPGFYITGANGRCLVKMDTNTDKWRSEAIDVLLSRYPYPVACGECGRPKIEDYCCPTCGTSTP